MARVDLFNKPHVFCWKINCGMWEGIISNLTAATLSDPGAIWVATQQGWGSSANSPR